MPQHLPPVQREWLFSPNNRINFVSLNDTMARLLFGLKNFLVATIGYTVKYTCDGTTGPSSPSDHTDRWASFSNVTTRGTAAATAQSFAVLTDGNGCDLLLTYQGATDDVARVSFSPSGVFTPAGTPTQQPTATDEQVMVSAQSLITSTASLDRVWHAMATRSRQLFRIFIYRANALTYSWGLEVCNTAGVLSLDIINFSPPVVGWANNNSTLTGAGNGSVIGPSTAGSNGGVARINSTNASIGGCGEGYQGSFASAWAMELQGGGVIIVPVGFMTVTAGVNGKVANRFDCWYAIWQTLPAQGDGLGDLTHVLFGTGIHPWDGVTYPAVA